MFENYFRHYVEELIREIISNERYGVLQAEKISELSIQLTLFFTNILLSIVGAILVGIVAYALVSRHQTKSVQITKEIERQRLLHELEKAFQEISSTSSVWLKNTPHFNPALTYKFTVALTGQIPWTQLKTIKYDWSTSGDRLIVFTDNGGLLSSSVLHEALFWFRRLYRAYAAGLLNVKDLYEMWRQILPFATDFRYSFMIEYFGGKKRQGSEDLEAIEKVITEVLRYCYKHGKKVPFDYLNGRLDQSFKLPKELLGTINTASNEPIDTYNEAKDINISEIKEMPGKSA